MILGNPNLCLGDSTKLSVNNIPGYHYRWYKNGFPTSNNSDTFNMYTVYTAGIYTVNIITDKNCSALMKDTSVTVSVKPNPPIISGNTKLCAGDSIKLDANVISGFGYLWTGPKALISQTQKLVVANADTGYTGLYYLYHIRNGGSRSCDTSYSNSTTVEVHSHPSIVTIQLNGSNTLCSGDSVQLSVPQETGMSYRWKLNGNNTPNAGDTIPFIYSKNSGVYSVKETNIFGCSSEMSGINITVNTRPVTSSITGNAIVGTGSIQAYQVVNTTGSIYQWMVMNGNQTSGGNSNSIQVQWVLTPNSGYVKVVETNTFGCRGDTVTKTVSIINTAVDSLKLGLDSVKTDYNALVKKVAIRSNRSWNVTNPASWITILPMNGSGNDSITLFISNNTGSFRTATITVTAGIVTRYLIVNQTGNVGLNDLIKQNLIQVYPNPTSGGFTLDNRLPYVVNFTLINMNGQIVVPTQTVGPENRKLLDPGLNAGVYFVVLSTETSSTAIKLMVIE
jgi:hypothetical protein